MKDRVIHFYDVNDNWLGHLRASGNVEISDATSGAMLIVGTRGCWQYLSIPGAARFTFDID